MKKKIAILGSTGSIGKNTVNIIQKNQKNFEVKLLSTNKNIKEILNQVKKLNVKNIIVTDYSSYKKITSKSFLYLLMILTVLSPIDPVDPNIAIFFFILLKIYQTKIHQARTKHIK